MLTNYGSRNGNDPNVAATLRHADVGITVHSDPNNASGYKGLDSIGQAAGWGA